MRALISTYKWELWLIVLYSFLRWAIFIAQPVLIALILDYIQNKSGNEKEIYYGLALILSYNLLDVISNLIMEQSDFIQAVIGINSKHGIVGMIYDKVLMTSTSTNNRFSQGEIINFINVDVEKISNIASNLSNATRLPFQIIFSFCFLFYFFEFSLSASMGWGAFFTLLNYLIGVTRGLLQSKIYSEKDKRMSVTNEVINSIKIIKFNSLISNFVNKILKIRNKELFFIKISLLIELLYFLLLFFLVNIFSKNLIFCNLSPDL